MRITSIAKPDEDLSSTFCLAEDVYVDDLLSSYQLKSSLFRITTFDAIDSSESPCSVAIKIYKSVSQTLQTNGLCSWIDEGGRLNVCSGRPAHDRCRLKVKLMLAMTRKILQWLHDNEAQLQDIDYADGVD